MNLWEPLKKIQGLWPLRGRMSQHDQGRGSAAGRGAVSLASDYELIDTGDLNYDAFGRLVRLVIRELKQPEPGTGGMRRTQRHDWFYERGQLPDKRRYLYLQRWNDEGWLYEEAGSGWTIARAVKIVHEQRFLRARESWEAVSLLRQRQPGGLLRVYSHRYGDEPLCLAIYEDLFIEELRRILRSSLESGV